MFYSYSGCNFNSVESFNSLSNEQRRLVYWCDLYMVNGEFRDELIDKDYSNGVFYELYEVDNYYISVILANKDPNNNDDIIEVEAKHDLIEFRKKNNPEYWAKFVGDSFDNLKGNSLPQGFYKRNTIYVDLPYKNLLEMISELLVTLGYWEVDDNDSPIKEALINKWKYPDHNFTQVFQSIGDPFLAGSGIGIYLSNTEYLVCHKKELPISIPTEIYNRTNNLPHLIQIETSDLSVYPIQRYDLTLSIAKHIHDKGGRAYIFTTDNKLLAIKNDINLTIEERIEQIHAYALNFDSNENIIKAKDKAQKTFSNIWNILEVETQQFLITGIFLYNLFKDGQPFILDTSPAAIEFAKCFEKEVTSKLLIPYREYFNKKFIEKNNFKSDLEDPQISKMTVFLLNKNKKPPELGTFAYFLGLSIHSKKRMTNSITLMSFISFVNELEDPDFILNPKKMLKYLELITTKYRNGAAHTEALHFDVLNEFFDLLDPQLDGQIGLLDQFINSIIAI